MFSGAVAILATVDLIIASAERARLHLDLAKRFAALEAKILRRKEHTRDELNELIAERLMIESDEPPVMRVLDCQCHNELCSAMGEDECEFAKIDSVQGFFSQIVDLWPSKIKKRVRAKPEVHKACVSERA